MPWSAKAVANEFLRLAEADGEKLDPLKLQKLVYFAHGWHLALSGEPLLDEEVQAWDFGPVVVSVYHEFKEFGMDPIMRKAHRAVMKDGELVLEEPVLEEEYPRALVQEVWEKYGPLTGIQLANMTHLPGTPWEFVQRRFHGAIPRGVNLPDSLIRARFKAELEAAHVA